MSTVLLKTDEGGSVELDEWTNGLIWLSITEYNAGGRDGYGTVEVSREEIAKLRDALTRWLEIPDDA